MRTTHSHDLARPRRTLQETQACSRQVSKKLKKIKTNREKRKKENPFGPWPSLSSAVFAKISGTFEHGLHAIDISSKHDI
jgi:hypothetical protein